MVWWLAPSRHSQKVLGSTPGWGVYAWVLSGYSGFLTLSKNLHVRLIGVSKIVLKRECVCGCLSRLSLCGPVMNWRSVQDPPASRPMTAGIGSRVFPASCLTAQNIHQCKLEHLNTKGSLFKTIRKSFTDPLQRGAAKLWTKIQISISGAWQTHTCTLNIEECALRWHLLWFGAI